MAHRRPPLAAHDLPGIHACKQQRFPRAKPFFPPNTFGCQHQRLHRHPDVGRQRDDAQQQRRQCQRLHQRAGALTGKRVHKRAPDQNERDDQGEVEGCSDGQPPLAAGGAPLIAPFRLSDGIIQQPQHPRPAFSSSSRPTNRGAARARPAAG